MANNTNTQLRENPRLQRPPKTERDWVQFINELQKWVVDLSVTGRLTSDAIMPPALLSNMGSIQTTLPVTATDAGASASVSIASHTLSRTSGDVSYNAGSITGLAYDTRYWIYVDDANFGGGAVTYNATTSKSDIVGDLGRYFVSEVRTPVSAGSDTTGSVGAGFAVLEGDISTDGLSKSTTSSSGVIALATTAEVDSGTDSTKAITPDALEASSLQAAVDLINDVSTAIYVPTNDVTDRGWDANLAAGAITNPPTQAEVENIRDAVLELSDVVATLVTDLQTKNVLG